MARIGLFSPEQTSRSGQPHYVKNLAKGLQELGHYVFCADASAMTRCVRKDDIADLDVAVINDYAPWFLQQITAKKIYNFCHSKYKEDRPIKDEKITAYITPRQQVTHHWDIDSYILPIPVDSTMFNPEKNNLNDHYTIIAPCNQNWLRVPMLMNLLDRARRESTIRVLIIGQDDGHIDHTHLPPNLTWLAETHDVPYYMAQAHEVAGIYIGTVTIEGWFMDKRTSVYNEDGSFKYVQRPDDYFERHNYLDVAKKFEELI